MIRHEQIEKNSGLMLVLTLVIISIGGLIEIVPLFFINDTIEVVKKEITETSRDANGKRVRTKREVDAIRPYTPLEQLGRNIYIREGCYACHSQQIRPMQDEYLRYGYYSLAAESQFDHPFQWGSKRTGPDLARVGGKYSNRWQSEHLKNPRSVEPKSIMPGYPYLSKNDLYYKDVKSHMKALRITGVPYSSNDEEYKANVERFGANVADLLVIDNAIENLEKQAKDGNYDPGREGISEMAALVAYLQVLGTMYQFKDDDGIEYSKFR
ncbi:cytochrome-c oxidase, cbb3-type subunit II [Wohlfahrtiimonas larvae]|uniref:Cytochrome-c oxidase, cbb3-type subunit II n=1 Tax=Wohlfahrtiimonas larvae TaxID=1157986 RepID=A0ABP9MHK1_9GAMM|nr:cytochrome-c oxidase, cbb3-type subunit II [Wohlfahrtiimonas larvae]